MGRQHKRRGRVGKNQHWQKDRRALTAELNIYLEDPISARTSRRAFHNSNIQGRVAIAKPLIIESNVKMRRRCCQDRKTWTSDNWKRAPDIVR
jgi:hypothetical protein